MGFLHPSESIIHPNSPMDEDHTRIAAQFVDELLEIGVVRWPPAGMKVVTRAAFAQRDEWRELLMPFVHSRPGCATASRPALRAPQGSDVPPGRHAPRNPWRFARPSKTPEP